jgi:hypothetical protein
MSGVGATPTCRNVRNPAAMGWQTDFELAVLNRLYEHALRKGFTSAPSLNFRRPTLNF